MLKKLPLISLALASLLLTACGDSDEPEQAKFSLGVSDAPVEEADAVFIEIDSIKLTAVSVTRQETVIENFAVEGDRTVEKIQINLLDFPGAKQLKIIDETQGITLDNGTYTMELVVVDAGSYVVLDNDANKYDIKIPSSRLKLGEFIVNNEAIQIDDKPAYTIEFDLTQSLVLRGNDPAKNGFLIKPHGVRIVSLYGDIAGTVSSENMNLGACMVYLYDGTHTLDAKLADIFDSSDDVFEFEGDISTEISPLAATTVAVDGTYSIGFVPQGAYTVALRCNTEIDDNVQYDELTIPSFVDDSQAGNLQSVNVSANTTSEANF